MITPKHRRCTRRRHHLWQFVHSTWTGWAIYRCAYCGRQEI